MSPRSKCSDAKLKVGVTLFIRGGQQSIWENGIFQNCFFLIELLRHCPLVGETFIVKGGTGDLAQSDDFLGLAPAPVVSLAEAMESLDLVIELSAQIDAEWGRAFVALGGVLIGMHVANDLVIDAERMAFDLPSGFLMAPVPYSEVWTLPAFEKTCASYYSFGLHVPVRTMPHLWSPALVERSLAARGAETRFAYQPGRSRWRAAILEPNISTVKTCHLPLLLCDVAHRLNPRAIEYLRVYNTLQLKENSDFVAFAKSNDLVKQGLATFEGRFPIFEIMGTDCDVIVSHHWENAQNYLYYEALYGGFPLVHNSHLLGDCGYRYRDFDPEDGALALLQALAQHDRDLEGYRARASTFLASLDPGDTRNIAAFQHAISQAVGKERVE